SSTHPLPPPTISTLFPYTTLFRSYHIRLLPGPHRDKKHPTESMNSANRVSVIILIIVTVILVINISGVIIVIIVIVVIKFYIMVVLILGAVILQLAGERFNISDLFVICLEPYNIHRFSFDGIHCHKRTFVIILDQLDDLILLRMCILVQRQMDELAAYFIRGDLSRLIFCDRTVHLFFLLQAIVFS